MACNALTKRLLKKCNNRENMCIMGVFGSQGNASDETWTAITHKHIPICPSTKPI